jgi:PAS domain S-box-containing protein
MLSTRQPRHILIVAPHPGDRTLVRGLLERIAGRPYQIHEAEDGRGGLSMAGSTELACILLDAALPDMDSTTFLASLGALGDGAAQIPVLLLAAEGEAPPPRAVDCLPKEGLTPAMLAVVIRQAIAGAAQRRELLALSGRALRGREELEQQRRERTEQLLATVAQLREEVAHRERVEAELRERKAHLDVQASILAQINDAVIATDGELRVISMNRAAEELYGYQADEALGRPLHEVNRYEWPTPESERAAFESLLATGGWRGEVIHHSRTGRRLVIDANVTMTGQPDSPLGFIAVLRDITARREAEEALRESNERNDLVVSGSSDGIWDWKLVENSAYYSPRFLELMGQPGGAYDKDITQVWELVHPDDRARVRQAFDAHLAQRLPFKEEVRLRTGAGEQRWFLVRGQASWDAEGRPTRMAGSLSDIHDGKLARAALEQLNRTLEERIVERTAELRATNESLTRAMRLKDEFLAIMSHELRTPLNAILGHTDLLNEGLYGPLTEAQERSVGTIASSGRHLLELITDILDLSQIEAGALTLDVGPVAVAALCEGSVRLVSTAAHAKGHSVELSLGDRATTVMGDERRLRQILVNLLSNAVKFTPAGGAIGLEVAADAGVGALRIAVWDTGIGISAEDKARLFAPFVQLDSALSRSYEGTGLGLALVRRLAQLHGGDVSVDSGLGRGSRFELWLPWSPAGAEAPLPLPEALPEPVRFAGSPEVLIVEDNHLNAHLLKSYLGRIGCAVRVARSGEEALGAAHTLRPDLILMDIQLPGLDGLETTRRMRGETSLASVPIFAVTALAMPGDRERCLEAGMDEYLTKPIALRRLAHLMRAYLEGHAGLPATIV